MSDPMSDPNDPTTLHLDREHRYVDATNLARLREADIALRATTMFNAEVVAQRRRILLDIQELIRLFDTKVGADCDLDPGADTVL